MTCAGDRGDVDSAEDTHLGGGEEWAEVECCCFGRGGGVGGGRVFLLWKYLGKFGVTASFGEM